MKLLIPIRNYPNVQHLTIAIRSITAHHTEIDELILIGMAPMPGIKHTLIRFKDYGQIERKAECIRDKVIAAINALKLKEPFLFANDDHIIFGRIDNVYDKGLLSQTLATKKPGGTYYNLIKNTIDHYGDAPDVDTHCPILMNPEGVLKTKFNWPEYGIGFKTCYAQENCLTSITAPDIKLSSGVPFGNLFFSFNPDYDASFLNKIYPKKSIFEA